ncbi:MAG: MBL fold metallo-hydrolase [Bacteroidota bacterium]|nr:MBL fold metallo-hydrolase [Bacteroidota bacterium]MDP4274194.1 MBL fold metallo-hydrolase [Bacteroidota bacterium]
MRITFLGTGTSQGVPVIACNCPVCQSADTHDKRLRSSVLIEYKHKVLVIDTGPDFRQQMLRAKVKQLDAILYTHEHKDHVAGLDDVRAFNYISQRPSDIYAEERVQQAIKQEYPYIFTERKYPGVPQVNMHQIDGQTFDIEDISIQPIRVIHYHLPVLGYRIADFTYITDANFISDEEKKKMAGTKCLVINGLRKQKHLSHFCLSEALEIIREINPQQAFITHIGHQMGLYKDVQKELPPHVTLAYDGLTVDME